MARTTVNWDNWKKLLDDLRGLKITKHRKFDMCAFIDLGADFDPDRTTVTVAELRENGPACATAGCIAGYCYIFNAPLGGEPKINRMHYHPRFEVDQMPIHRFAMKHLGLTSDQADYVFSGGWTLTPLDDIKKAQAVRYMEKAYEARDVMVRLSGSKNLHY